MVSRLYRLDYVNGDLVSTLMGEYATQQAAQAAQAELNKAKPANWMISDGEPAARKDGSAVNIAAL